MHEAAKDEDGVVRLERRRGSTRLEGPVVATVASLGDKGAEELGAGVFAVDDRENVHDAPPLAAIRFTSRSRRSCRALVAACAIRPSGFSGSSEEALLLKKAYACFDWPASSRSGPTHSLSSSSE